MPVQTQPIPRSTSTSPESLDGDIPGRRAARSYMDSSTAIVHHRVVSTSFVPQLYDAASRLASCAQAVETTHRILCKVIAALPRRRRLPQRIFDYDPRLAELDLGPARLRCAASLRPLRHLLGRGRPATWRSASSTATAASGMNENREITHSVARTRPPSKSSRAAITWRAASCSTRGCDDVRRHLRHLRASRGTSPLRHLRLPAKRRRRRVPPVREALHRGRGIPCTRVRRARPAPSTARCCATSAGPARPRHLAPLRHQRRAASSGTSRRRSSRPCKAQKVALIGSFAGHIVHDKQIFEALFNPADAGVSDADEEIAFVERTVPQTRYLDDEAKSTWTPIRAEQGRLDRQAHRRLRRRPTCTPGCFQTQEQWERDHRDRFANGAAGAPFLVQRYITPFKTQILHARRRHRRLCPMTRCDASRCCTTTWRACTATTARSRASSAAWGPSPPSAKPMKGITCGHHLGRLERAQPALLAAPKSQDAGTAAVSPFPNTREAPFT